MKAKTAVVKSASLASRIAGISIMGFGISWKAPEPERKAVRDLLLLLEDRRALYADEEREGTRYVVMSILTVRDELTETLKRLNDKSPAIQLVRIMRAACRDLLTFDEKRRREHFGDSAFCIELGRLRGVFGQQIAVLSYACKIDVEPQLATILPPDPNSAAAKSVSAKD